MSSAPSTPSPQATPATAAPAVVVTPAAPVVATPAVPAAAPAAAPAPAAAATPAAATPAKPKKNPTWAAVSPFVVGGVSGMVATTIIQPLDMVKVQIQLRGEGAKGGGVSPFTVVKDLLSKEGPLVFYRGLSAGLLRQATYTTARLGLFRSLSDAMQGESKAPLPFWKKTVAGLAAGGLGAVFGTPADVALIRMQADSNLPIAERRNYTGVVNALMRITREEGLSGLFAGNSPVVIRAMALNVGMLATHDQAKEQLRTVTSDMWANVGAKLISGFFASAFSLPFDFIKTRLQKQKKDASGKLPYRGFIHCASEVAKKEGPMAFYRGFSTYYFRIAPHAMITLAVVDEINKYTKEW